MLLAISTARLEARISTDIHSMLKRAAELHRRTMTDFVVSVVQDAEQRASEQAEVIRLSMDDREFFCASPVVATETGSIFKTCLCPSQQALSAE